jgi:hypothetical protein
VTTACNPGLPALVVVAPGSSLYGPTCRHAECGQALLILVVMMSIATMLLVYGSTTEIAQIVKGEARTRIALEQAKQALIGRAVADANRPGSLPCPDGGDDGSADLFVGSACPSYLGRLPWRTLGVGDLRDENGERLWYALSVNFRDHPSAPPLNSDTKGTLTVYSNSDANVVSDQAIAIVFAPGYALPGQRRDDGVELCSTTLKTVQRNRCAANYLDTAASVNNSSAAGPYVAARLGSAYNDKLAVIVAADLMPLVERRVALEARNALLAYRAASTCACYPWADSGSDGISDAGANRGRLPSRTALPQNWPPGTLPAYFAPNDWARVLYYAVGRSALEGRGESCSTCADPSLTLDGASGFDVVLVTAGYAGATRPSAKPTDYFDDAENTNADDRYVSPASQKADRDRTFSILGSQTGCTAHARVLIDNAPCGTPSNALRPSCVSASAALASCTCSVAASTLLKSPCTNGLIAATCDTAITQLRGCMS